jgi:hypothetical protein
MTNKKPPVPEYVRADAAMRRTMDKHTRYMKQLGHREHIFFCNGYSIQIKREGGDFVAQAETETQT